MQKRSLALLGTMSAILCLAGPAAAEDWNGFYAGVHGTALPQEGDVLNVPNAGFGAGVQAGYNMQMGPGVLGIEVEADKNLRQTASGPSASLDQQGQLSAKARAGVTLGGTLLYGTAGYGAAYLGSGGTAEEGWHGGLLLGGGVEQRLTDDLSLRVGYEQLRLEDVELASGGVTSAAIHSVKAGMNFAF